MTREEAIKRIKAWNLDEDDMEVLSAAIPELTESEDNRIRKAVITYLSNELHNVKQLTPYTNEFEDWIAYLEKQKEQKPIEQGCPQFVFDDVLALECAMDIVYRKGNEQKLYEALKSLHSRLIDVLVDNVKQKPTEWSEDIIKDKVISYLVDKGYPVSTNGEIPTYQETFDMINNAIKHANKQEQPEVDLKMVVRIDNIVMNMLGEGYNNGYKTRPFYEEVLQRLNARKEKNK